MRRLEFRWKGLSFPLLESKGARLKRFLQLEPALRLDPPFAGSNPSFLMQGSLAHQEKSLGEYEK